VGAARVLPAACWPTLCTGVPPVVHGVYYRLQWDAAVMRLRQISDWLYCEPFWCELERRGLLASSVSKGLTLVLPEWASIPRTP
jgi:predicted AlkP superfamily phosphohydrolase/phosphomutase